MNRPPGAVAASRNSSRIGLVAAFVALVLMALALLAAPKPANAFGSMSFPVAVIDAPVTYARVNTELSFDGSGSYGIEFSVPQQWDWNFGDGTTASGTTTSHTFTRAGLFIVTLTVTDQYGVTGTATRQVIIWDYPVAIMSATPTTGRGPLTVAFDGSASTSEGWALQSYAWDFGDGTTATGPTASHTYAAPGRYIAGLSIKNVLGWGSSAYQTINVTEPMAPPTNFTATSPSRSTVTLKWTNRMTTIHQMEIQRCAGSRCTTFPTVNYVDPAATTYTEGGLKSGTTFRYRLKVTDIAGVVGYSSIASVKVR